MGPDFQIHNADRNTKSISLVNSHSTSSAETVPATVKMNDNSVHCSKTPAVNDNCKEQFVEIPLVNGKYSNEVSVNKTSTFNGSFNKIVENTLMVKENREEKMPINNITVNRNYKTAAEELSTASGIFNEDNGSSLPSKDGSAHDSSDETEDGFIKVTNKRRRNREKKPVPSLPVTQKVRHHNGIDKNKLVKIVSTSHIKQKPPVKDVFPIRSCEKSYRSSEKSYRSSEKSYSSVLINGQTKNICQDFQIKPFADVTKCTKLSKSSNNCNLQSTSASLNHLPVEPAKNVITSDTFVASRDSEDSCTKVDMDDFSTQTDFSLNQMSKLSLNEDEVRDPSLPSNYVDDEDGRAIGSHGIADCESVVSNDSGRGESEHSCDTFVYYFVFPNEKIGLLLGAKGRYKNKIESETGVKLIVHIDPHAEFVTAEINGTISQINKARRVIEGRFHFRLRQYSDPSEWNLLSTYYNPILPVSSEFPAIVSCICDPSMFWAQPNGHPLKFQVDDLERIMSHHFNTDPDVPKIDCPKIGNVLAVVAHFHEGEEKRWVRGCITHVAEEEGMVGVRYLDHGGGCLTPISDIRPMKHEYFSMQFFAAECRLYGVLPASGDVWSEEAVTEFKNLCSCDRLNISVIAKIPKIYYVRISVYELYDKVDVASILIGKGLAIPDPMVCQSPDLQ